MYHYFASVAAVCLLFHHGHDVLVFCYKYCIVIKTDGWTNTWMDRETDMDGHTDRQTCSSGNFSDYNSKNGPCLRKTKIFHLVWTFKKLCQLSHQELA